MITIICNPVAGGGRALSTKERLEQALNARGVPYTMRVSEYAGHTVELVRQAADEGSGGIYTLGGDGTIYEAINALAGRENPPPLGFLPGGTGNDFTRSLDIARDPVEALNQLLSGHPVDVDLWKTDRGNYFINVAGLGLDIDLADNAERTKKVFRGMTAYVVALFMTLARFKYKHVRLTLDGKVYEREVVVVTCSNGVRYGGGILVAPRASLFDGKMDVVIINKVPKVKVPFILGQYIKGEHVKMPFCEYVQASDILIESLDEPLVYETDGEAHRATPFHITPAGRLRTLAPAHFRAEA